MYQKISATYTTRVFYEVENFLNLVKYIANIFLYIHRFLMNNVITQSLYLLNYSNCYIKSFCDVKKDTMVPRFCNRLCSYFFFEPFTSFKEHERSFTHDKI